MLDNIKKEFSTRTLVLIPIAIVINMVIGISRFPRRRGRGQSRSKKPA